MTEPMRTDPVEASKQREWLEHEIDYVLDDDVAGEVRVTYADGHSEIKQAKTLLLDDIMRLVDSYTVALLRDSNRRRRIEGKLEAAKHFKNYMISTSPFISEIVDPYIERLEACLEEA